jgi:hypothetical protein
MRRVSVKVAVSMTEIASASGSATYRVDPSADIVVGGQHRVVAGRTDIHIAAVGEGLPVRPHGQDDATLGLCRCRAGGTEQI